MRSLGGGRSRRWVRVRQFGTTLILADILVGLISIFVIIIALQDRLKTKIADPPKPDVIVLFDRYVSWQRPEGGVMRGSVSQFFNALVDVQLTQARRLIIRAGVTPEGLPMRQLFQETLGEANLDDGVNNIPIDVEWLAITNAETGLHKLSIAWQDVGSDDAARTVP